MKKRYDIIYSLGKNCACATYLKRNNLRLTSGPFDWVGEASLADRAKIIEQDFNGFINENYLEKRESPNTEHDLYFDSRSKVSFVHDFLPGVSVQESLPAIKEKYSRRIARFYENVRSAKRALFIYFSIYEKTPIPQEEIFEMERVLSEKFGAEKIELWVIEHDENASKQEKLSCKKLSDRSIFWRGFIQGDDELLGNIERCEPIFQQAALSLSYEIKTRVLYRVSRIVENLVCAFIFSKKKRRPMRRKIRSFFGQRY